MKPIVPIFIASLLCVFTTQTHAQTFYKTFDVGMNPNVVSCTEKTDGDFLLLIQSEIPYADYFYLTDLDPTGQVMWTKRVDFPHDDVLPLQMKSNGDSTYTILMNSYAKPTFNDRSVMLLNIDGNANVLWTNTYGENQGGNYEIPYTFSRTSTGGYVIAAEREYNSTAYPALFLTDNAGNLIWSKSYDPYLVVKGWFTDVKQTPDGGFIACGESDPQALLMKTDSAGNIQWMKKYDNGSMVFTYSVTVTSDSCYLLYGLSFGIPSASTYLMKVDANGNTLWHHAYNFWTPYIKPFPIYESGGMFTFMSDVAYGPNSNTTRFSVNKADANGALIFTKLYHPAMKSVMSDMQLTHANGLIASGSVMDTITFDNHGFFMKSFNAITPECLMEEMTYLDHSDTFNEDTGAVWLSFTGDAVPIVLVSADNIIDHNLCGPLTIEEAQSGYQFTIAPDPADGNLNVTFISDELMHAPVAVSILDVTGRLVYRNLFHGQQHAVIDVSKLTIGIYFCRVEMNGGEEAIKKIAVSK